MTRTPATGARVGASRTAMEVLFILLPIALGFVLAAVFVFAWAVRDGQFDDLDTPALRALLDDPRGADDEPRR